LTTFRTWSYPLSATGEKQTWANGLPVSPPVATLEDWCLFSPVIVEKLETVIRNRLADAGVNERVLATMPYTIASIEEFEIAGQAIARTGVQRFFSCKTSVEHRSVMLLPFMHWRFSDALEDATNLLSNKTGNGLPEIANLQLTLFRVEKTWVGSWKILPISNELISQQ
jgi:hypothetical protein